MRLSSDSSASEKEEKASPDITVPGEAFSFRLVDTVSFFWRQQNDLSPNDSLCIFKPDPIPTIFPTSGK